MNNINLTKLTTRTLHAIATINYCLHHLYTWVSCATAALPTMSANCIPSELVVCRQLCTLPVLTVRILTVVVNNINLTKLTTRTTHAIAAINYCLHHLYTWVSCATANYMSANCIPSELVVCRAVTRPLFFHTGVARARLYSALKNL